MNEAMRWRAVLAEVDQAGLCAHPIRLRGITLDRRTGELAEGGLLVACKDRRAAVCPSCSRLYQADAWQLVAAGIRGGKGVSPGVVEHPQLFVTLTAPSFGAVHRASGRPGGGTARPCRPRRGGPCRHGATLSCLARHHEGDPLVGEPLCPFCFDYQGAVLWNAHLSRLWGRTSLNLYLEAGRAAGMNDREIRSVARLSYMKVVEFQRRGLVHVHAVIRADGPSGPCDPPPPWLDVAALSAAVSRAVARSTISSSTTRASWGAEHDTRVLVPGQEGDSTAIAAYVAKYATKTADGTAWLAHPIRSAAHIERLRLRPHIVKMVRTAWWLGGRKDLAHLRLRAHAHTLGYGGQFSSKSLRFSTTFGALRQARADYVGREPADDFDYDGEWRYVGRGYGDPAADQLAAALLEARCRVPSDVPERSRDRSHVP